MGSLILSRLFPAFRKLSWRRSGAQEIRGSELPPSSLTRWEAKVGALSLVSDPKRDCQADEQWNIRTVSSPAG